tara:strand:+ start:1173 stop:1505 length:333 start_codon:yes stop_codon:yes gene_type:complete
MAKYLSVYEANNTQYVNLKVDDFVIITILDLSVGVKVELSNGRGFTLNLNVAGDATGTKNVREYIQSNIMDLINSSATTTVLQLPQSLPFLLNDEEGETQQAQISTIVYA